MSRRSRIVVAVVIGAILFLPGMAHAYLGPGGVITAIGAMVALLVAVVASVAGFIWFPLKRLLTWVRSTGGREDEPTDT